ncbi:unnamed protein product [Vitrella brassicaformis CCMP3155]|uniref:Uncharacterized protein n=3 Tax=Vitrella brassicaformis TaxID=1169539 RepID=A0A0G4ENF0_VITBC|nr:unnamed protein product [Vitrella brassicaformis CCMP3155]|eukprot:CEL99367.1 unnamed protein product [Vitrella brassicaformis CCMP3155]
MISVGSGATAPDPLPPLEEAIAKERDDAASPAAAGGGGGERSGTQDYQQRKSGPWLHAWHDPVAGMVCFSQHMCVADLHGDGDHRLVLVDRKKRIRIYRGTSIQWEQRLLEPPVAVQCFYHDTATPPIPTLVVAAGHQLFIYRHLQPYMKFALPPLPIDEREKDTWNRLEGLPEGEGVEEAFNQLMKLREAGVQLSRRSMDLLAVDDVAQRAKTAEEHKGVPLVQLPAISCMETLRQNIDQPTGVSVVVVAAEAFSHKGIIFILNPHVDKILRKVELDGTPAFVHCLGLYDVEYRLTVATRDGTVHTIKNGALLGSAVELETPCCGLVRLDKFIFVGCMDSVIHVYHFKGKKSHSIHLPCPLTTLTGLSLPRLRVQRALLVTLNDGQVRLYGNNGKDLLHSFSLLNDDIVTGALFGQYGREEGALVLSCKSGAILVKILSRTSTLEPARSGSSLSDGEEATGGPVPAEQDVPLNIPKKTRLYVEQMDRERQSAVHMHRTFQRDLCRLRLKTARAYVSNLVDMGQSPTSVPSTSGAGEAHLSLTADVIGLTGPHFDVQLRIHNAGSHALSNVCVMCVSSPPGLYALTPAMAPLPLLLPQHTSVHTIRAQEQPPEGGGAPTGAGQVRCFVVRMAVEGRGHQAARPLTTVYVQMPISEGG